MEQLSISLKNCYGIKSFDHIFDFSFVHKDKTRERAYAIYAPNGSMKTSFSKTFIDLSNGNKPREERYGHLSDWSVKADGVILPNETIYVLKAGSEFQSDSTAVTNVLINPEDKAKYDALVVDLEKQKISLTNALQKKSLVKKSNIEKTLLNDMNLKSLPNCIQQLLSREITDDLGIYQYDTIFDSKVLAVLESKEFIGKASEFNDRYQELFSKTGSIYKKGVFNPAKAEASFTTLTKQGFFETGHRVHFNGEDASVNKEELDKKLEEINRSIDSDDTLKKLRIDLAKNAQTQAFNKLIEDLSPSDVELFLDRIKPDNLAEFRKDLWATYVQNSIEANIYLETYSKNKEDISKIEEKAATEVPRWTKAIDLFNDRFLDMPFSLSVKNLVDTRLGKEKAELEFTFRDGKDIHVCPQSEVTTKMALSQGENRALYLLYFIFEVEARILNNQETLFIIDDVADSFDYKNKVAIVQYLKDLSETNYFYQIILTHNFDFFRSLSNSYVHYERCLMTNKSDTFIRLERVDGIKNYFIGVVKPNMMKSKAILCASVPFTRNLIEYTKGQKDPDYLTLTNLLHWKENTAKTTVGEYLTIYNSFFNTTHNTSCSGSFIDYLFIESSTICKSTTFDGLNLENKILLSMAIRMQSEIFITSKIRIIKGEKDFWCSENNQFAKLIGELHSLDPELQEMKILNRVSVTVSSNIHLNSFMYEPILDLTLDHLIKLYQDVESLGK